MPFKVVNFNLNKKQIDNLRNAHRLGKSIKMKIGKDQIGSGTHFLPITASQLKKMYDNSKKGAHSMINFSPTQLKELKKVDRVSGGGILPDVQNDTNYNPDGYGMYGGEVDASLIDELVGPAKKGMKDVGSKIYDEIDPSGSYKDVMDDAIDHIDNPAYLATLAYNTISDSIKGKTPFNSTQATKNEYNNIMKARKVQQLPEEDRRTLYETFKQGAQQTPFSQLKRLVPRTFDEYDQRMEEFAQRTPRSRDQLLADRKARRGGQGIATYGAGCMECGCNCSGGRLMPPRESFPLKKKIPLSNLKRM